MADEVIEPAAAFKGKSMNLSLPRAIIIATLSAAPISAMALPTFSSVVSGSATFSTAGNILTIHTVGNTEINWGSFFVDSGEIIFFAQSDPQYLVSNTVIGGAPAQIYGSISSNGGISLDAAAGIFVGASGTINAPSLTLNAGSGPIVIENSNFFPGPSGPINPGGGGLIGGGGVIISSVPEPETYAMMLAGLGLLGLMARRRKQKSIA